MRIFVFISTLVFVNAYLGLRGPRKVGNLGSKREISSGKPSVNPLPKLLPLFTAIGDSGQNFDGMPPSNGNNDNVNGQMEPNRDNEPAPPVALAGGFFSKLLAHYNDALESRPMITKMVIHIRNMLSWNGKEWILNTLRMTN